MGRTGETTTEAANGVRERESPGDGVEVGVFQGNWLVRMWWPEGAIAGGPQRLTVTAVEDAPPGEVRRGISSTVLRRLDIAGAVRRAQALAPQAPPWRIASERLEDLATRTGDVLAAEGVSDRYLARLCGLYDDLARRGVRAPVPWLAERIGRSPQTVRDHLKAARRDGLMTALTGKSGGELTDRARVLLASDPDFPGP
ncbi:hypothetical protein ABT160_20420 [Streptomyces sp. NPDC001941]|uniref:hypothetical protein n=1 Tax=Streptomyces sp. NPDC001941 TaxID=3154659 RepID=UPI00331BE6E4